MQKSESRGRVCGDVNKYYNGQKFFWLKYLINTEYRHKVFSSILTVAEAKTPWTLKLGPKNDFFFFSNAIVLYIIGTRKLCCFRK